MESLGDILRRLQHGTLSGVTAFPGADTPAAAEAPEEVCSLCDGRGWVRSNVPLGHPDFGKALPCACQREATQGKRLAQLQRYSNLGPLTGLTFGATDPRGRSAEPQNQRLFAEALQKATAYAQDPRGWLVLTGASGLGKTHLAAAVANGCMERGIPVFFVAVPDLLDHLRATFSPSSEVAYDELLEQVRSVPLLVLDDLGTQSATPWAQEKLYQVLSHRFSAQLPTVVTTTIPLDRLEDRLRTRLEDPRLSQVVSVGRTTVARLAQLGVVEPEMLARMTFESFDTRGNKAGPGEQDSLKAALRAAKNFAHDPDGWLALGGPTGVGKTHLAVAIVSEQTKAGQRPFFTLVADLLDHLRYTFSPDSRVTFDELFEQVKQTPLLILDDFQTENATPWAREKLYQIIVHRHNARLPTVITSRFLEPGEAIDRHGQRVRDPIVSRLLDTRVVNPVPIEAPDYRNQERPVSGPRSQSQRHRR